MNQSELDNAIFGVCQPAVTPGPQAHATRKSKIMIVDDEPLNTKVARKYLTLAGYSEFVVLTDPTRVMKVLDKEDPDLLLLDIMMPGVSGLEILQTLRTQERFQWLPVLILTAVDDRETKSRALDLGATDFLPKPVDPTDLVPRVRNALVLKAHHDHLQTHARKLESEVRARTAELEESHHELIRCLARAAEYRDNETGRHVIRVGRYVGIIARQLGLSDGAAELLEQAALLHDVGKIGIPDSILLKPGRLDSDEVEYMRQHCLLGSHIFEPVSDDEFSEYAAHTVLGAKIAKSCKAPVMELAARIALTHHEKWDGSGYPARLAGTQIPLEGRITAAADVFDALSSKRPYKPAFDLEKCFAMLEQGRGTHFDPQVLDAFFARRDDIIDVHIGYADAE